MANKEEKTSIRAGIIEAEEDKIKVKEAKGMVLEEALQKDRGEKDEI